MDLLATRKAKSKRSRQLRQPSRASADQVAPVATSPLVVDRLKTVVEWEMPLLERTLMR